MPAVAVNRHNLTYLLYGAVIFAVLGLLPMVSARLRSGRDDDARGGKNRRKMRRQAQRVATDEDDDIEDAMIDRQDGVAAAVDDEDEDEEIEMVRAKEKKKKKKDKGRARV